MAFFCALYIYVSLIALHCDASNFTCLYGDDCYGQTLNCVPDQDCTIECIGYRSCREVIINCPPSNNSCNILCDGNDACWMSTINASLTYGSLNIISTNYRAASSTTVNII